MSAPNAVPAPPPPPAAARPPSRDELDVGIARKLFFAGCACLPWLWVMCLLHYRARFFDKGALGWYLRAQAAGLAVVTACFVAWVVTFQQSWRGWGDLGTNLLIYVPNQQWWLDD